MKNFVALNLLSIALLLSTQTFAQEIIVGGGGSNRTSAISSQVKSLKQNLQIQQNELTKLIVCNDNKKLYKPSDSAADSNGCVSVSSPDLAKLLTCNSRNKFYNPTDTTADGQGCVTPPRYSWNVGTWGTCSATCGTGKQRRSITCKREDNNTTVSDNFCPSGSGAKPATSQSCTQSCNKNYTYKVRGGSGSNCKNIGKTGLPTWAANYTLHISWYDHGRYNKTYRGTKAAGTTSIYQKHCIHQGANATLTLTGR